MPLTDAELNQLEALCAHATPGPWRTNARAGCSMAQVWTGSWGFGFDGGLRATDALFLVAAREAMPELIAEVRSLKTQLRRHEDAMAVPQAQLAKSKSKSTSPPKSSPKRRRSGGASS